MNALRMPVRIAFTAVALLSLVNVFAYQRATVTSGGTVSIVHTNSASLALTSTSPLVSYQNRVMQINFTRGALPGELGFRPTRTVGGLQVMGDRYEMRDVFRITNNDSLQCRAVQVLVSQGTPTNLEAIWGRSPTGVFAATQLAGALGGAPLNTVRLGPAGSGKNSLLVDFHWHAVQEVTSSGSFAIEVRGTVTASCP